MSTGRFEVSALAGKYFDWEKIQADPDSTYLSEEGMAACLIWLRHLEKYDYSLSDAVNIADSAGFLIAEGYSDVDVLTTKIMLAILADAVETLDAR